MTKFLQRLAATGALLAAAAGHTCASAQAQEMTPQEKESYKTALRLSDKTNNRAAIGILRDLYVKHPDNIDIAYNLGVCYVNASGNPDSTLYFLKRVAELDTAAGWTEARLELMLATARAEQLCGRPDEAIRICDDIDLHDSDRIFATATANERNVAQTGKILMGNPVRLAMRTVGEGVNSQWNDYRPILTAQEDTMYFTSRRPKANTDRKIVFDDGQFEEGLYVSVREGNKWDGGNWGGATPVSGLIVDRRGHAGQETATSISADGNTLYLCHDGDIYTSRKDARGKWQPAEPLPSPVNSAYNEGFAHISADGEELFFVSDAPGGMGGKDIWVSRRLPDGTWGKPRNLGPGVNTEGDEDAPFFHPQTNVLYFCSTGHEGMGGYDIFYSPRNDKGEFEASKNMGYPINSADDDLFFTPSADHDRGYYASIRWNSECKAPSYDIYEVEFEQPEQKTMAVLSTTVSADDLPAVRVFTMHDGETTGVGRPNSRTGRFVTIVPAGSAVDLVAVCGADTIRRQVATLKSQSYHALQKPVEIDGFVFARDATTATTAPRCGDDEGETAPSVAPLDLPYTVQIMSLRKELRPELLHRGLDADSVTEYRYRDGWFVYTYGAYATPREARQAQQKIRNATNYDDAFARNKRQYDKFVGDDGR